MRVSWNDWADDAMKSMDARAVDEGANFVVIEAESLEDMLFRENVGGIWYANPIHIYLDLLKAEGRAKDMAQHFRTEWIGF
jgi:hypothetical protein